MRKTGRPKAEDLKHRCTAHSKQTGEPCGQPAIPGGTTCRYHGGNAPQVKEAARRRLLEMADPALSKLVELISRHDEKTVGAQYQAAKDILDRIGLASKQEIEVTHVSPDEVAAYLEGVADGIRDRSETPTPD